MQINNSGDEKGDITTDTEETQRIIMTDFKDLFFLERKGVLIYVTNKTKLRWTKQLNRPITPVKQKQYLKIFQPKRAQDQKNSTQNPTRLQKRVNANIPQKIL